MQVEQAALFFPGGPCRGSRQGGASYWPIYIGILGSIGPSLPGMGSYVSCKGQSPRANAANVTFAVLQNKRGERTAPLWLFWFKVLTVFSRGWFSAAEDHTTPTSLLAVGTALREIQIWQR